MNIALIVAAGSGTRMKLGDTPKQFLEINNKPLLVYTVEAFQNAKNIDNICIVTNKDYVSKVKEMCEKFNLTKVNYICEGGETRQNSVFNGLNELMANNVKNSDIILIHDAARVMVSEDIINRNIELCKKYGAVDTVIPSPDTISKSKDGEKISELLNRSELFCGQTPQTFKFDLIYRAHMRSVENGENSSTDDANLAIKAGFNVYYALGSALNFKVTTQDDLKMLTALINNK